MGEETPNLISQLYNKRECKAIKNLFINDKESHKVIYQSIANRLFESEKFINAKAIDMLALLLKNNSFSAEDNEIHTVAVFIYKSIFYSDPLPYLSDGSTLEFSIKTLASLSFLRKAMEKRTIKKGAPSPDYYRKASQVILSRNGFESIAVHHTNWESFLVETFAY